MPRSRPPYPAEFRRQMVDLVRCGRTPEELSREFEPSAQAIRNWVKQTDLDEGQRSDGQHGEGGRVEDAQRWILVIDSAVHLANLYLAV